jgi:uncharacterized membrane protein
MSILKELQNLIKADIISEEVAGKIKDYYSSQRSSSTNRLVIAFGILGAILVGLGIILVIAHNWDNLSRGVKTFFAFFPLVIGQIACVYTLVKKQESTAWKEGSSAFLFFAIGAAISLVSQIYNIPGNISEFLITWTLLSLPVVYLMRSSIVSLLYVIAITYYGAETGYSYNGSGPYQYWLLLVGVLPYCYLLFKKSPNSNFLTFLNWLIPISVTICLGTLSGNNDELMFVAYFSMFGFLYLFGNSYLLAHKKLRNNGYKVLGGLGMIVLLLSLSFDYFWENLRDTNFEYMLISPEFLITLVFSLLASIMLLVNFTGKSWSKVKALDIMFLYFIVVFLLGLVMSASVVLINILVFWFSLMTIKEGAKNDQLAVMNFGLIVIAALVTCRFFDEDLSFVLRGLMFLIVGIGFFSANYWMLNKRKANEG